MNEQKSITSHYGSLLIDKEMTKADLRNETSIARSTMVKMVNNKYVALDVLVKWRNWKTARI